MFLLYLAVLGCILLMSMVTGVLYILGVNMYICLGVAFCVLLYFGHECDKDWVKVRHLLIEN